MDVPSNFTLPSLSKKEKNTRLLSITHTRNKHVYQVYVHIFIFVCFVSQGFLLLSYPGEEGTSGEPLQNHHRWKSTELQVASL